MSVGGLNLARRPFINGRPVTRVAVLLWLVGGLLLLGNVFVYLSYVQGTGEKRDELARVEQHKQMEQRKISTLNGRFANLNLVAQNEQVDFLNEKITERTFSWSQLFERISGLLPEEVRLTRLAPHGVVDPQSDRRRRGAPAPTRKKTQDGPVTLTINGEAKSDEAILRFIDNLFADPAFVEPDLVQETKDESKSVIKFDLRVGYLTKGALRPAISGIPAIAAPPSRRRTTVPLASTTGRTPRISAPVGPGSGVPGVGVPPRLGSEGGPGR